MFQEFAGSANDQLQVLKPTRRISHCSSMILKTKLYIQQYYATWPKIRLQICYFFFRLKLPEDLPALCTVAPNTQHIIDIHLVFTGLCWIVESSFNLGLPRWLSGKKSTGQRRSHRRLGFDPWVRSIPWSRTWQPTPVFLPGKRQGQRSLADYSPWGCRESDTTEHMPLHRAITTRIILES